MERPVTTMPPKASGDQRGIESDANASFSHTSPAAATGDLLSTLNARAPFPTLSPDEEKKKLQEGTIPPEVIYSGEAGKKLSTIDNNMLHPYTALVNSQFALLFTKEGPHIEYNSPALWNCLKKLDAWVDIGTGNGLVSNTAAFSIFNAHVLAKLQHMMQEGPGNSKSGKPRFVCCDLSQASLSIAENLANNNFYKLGELFDLSYYPGNFQSLLSDTSKNEQPRLITMFNVLANFSEKELQRTFTDMAAAMKSGDVFIPTFFQEHEMKEVIYPYNVPFQHLTEDLYNNPETKDRCVSAFCDRYKVDPSDIRYQTTWKNDGRNYIDITLAVKNDTLLHLPQQDGNEASLPVKECANNTLPASFTTLHVFRSYRMSKEYIQKLTESVGLKVDYRLESNDSLHIAPILYKP